jgi:hemerythrin
MEWYDSYCIGNEKIDSQHKELVEMISRLQESLTGATLKQETANAIKFLVQYTRQHFADEEELMERIAFEGYDHHKLQHEKLITEVTNVLLDIKKGKQINPFELFDFLLEWLFTHIKNEDKKIGRALAEA